MAYVLEGSVRRSGDKIRVTAQLIRADNGYHLWSKTYDRDVKDIFQVQDEIANAVVTALKAQLLSSQPLTSRHRTSNPQAFSEYLLVTSCASATRSIRTARRRVVPARRGPGPQLRGRYSGSRTPNGASRTS